MARLAEVYAEHDMAPEALDLYQKAAKLAPDDLGAAKGAGAALERLHRDGEAEDVWAALFEAPRRRSTTPGAARGAPAAARRSLLARQGRLGILAAQYRDEALRARKRRRGGGAAYGLLAADALVKLGRIEMAEELLRGLADTRKTPSLRADAWMGLAQVERARHRLGEALAALKKAAELAPARGRELYPQIAELSLQLYHDADALSYAKRAVAARARRRGSAGAPGRGAGEARGHRRRGGRLPARARDRRSAVEGLLHAGAAAICGAARRRAPPSSIAT